MQRARGRMRSDQLASHAVIRLESSAVLAPGWVEQVAAARSVIRTCRGAGVAAWRLADTHGHFVVLGDRAHAGQVIRRVQLGLQRTLGFGEGFEPARLRPVLDQRHLRNAVGYTLRQAEHHGTQDLDPWHVASSLPDLLGLRWAGWVHPAGRLPRLDSGALRGLTGWSGALWQGLDADDLHVLPAAAAAAVGQPDLRGRDTARALAKRAAAHLAHPVLGGAATGALLGVSASQVRRMQHQSCPPQLARAVLAQVSWRLEVERSKA